MNKSKIMKKMYKKPIVETQLMLADAHVMLLDSGSGPEPAPAPARSVGPSVPGDNL